MDFNGDDSPPDLMDDLLFNFNNDKLNVKTQEDQNAVMNPINTNAALCTNTIVSLYERESDRRLREVRQKIHEADNGNPVIKEDVPPVLYESKDDLENLCSMYRGIQGHYNSCYLDATLFSMFTFTSIFDHLIYRPKTTRDIPDYAEVQRVLREEIVHPLRANKFVNSEHVMKLRYFLETLGSVSGMTSEEKDPEELLTSLLDQILRAEPLLKMNSGQESNCYQLFVEKDDRLQVPTVQQLLEQSFLDSKVKLTEVPQCLILQMPRFGRSFKMYERIIPSQVLDITDIIETSARLCRVCGDPASHECEHCAKNSSATMAIHDGGMESGAFCTKCVKTFHDHADRADHTPRPLESQVNKVESDHHSSSQPRRIYLDLFAVVCIETSHYVAFTKCGKEPESPWCFFDSMADREGESDGINIPAIVACRDLSRWLSDEQSCHLLHKDNSSDRLLSEHARRLLRDAYVCMYQITDFTNSNK